MTETMDRTKAVGVLTGEAVQETLNALVIREPFYVLIGTAGSQEPLGNCTFGDSVSAPVQAAAHLALENAPTNHVGPEPLQYSTSHAYTFVVGDSVVVVASDLPRAVITAICTAVMAAWLVAKKSGVY